MMLLPTLPSLSELCTIRIAYSMWTRRDVVHRCSKEDLLDEDSAFLRAEKLNLPLPKSSKDELFDEFEGVIMADVQCLPLPGQLKSRVLNNVKPVGQRLLSFLYLWLAKTQLKHSREWLTDEMLSECLILNADGLINQRKTAEKIFSSRMLPDVLAFRLACVNFLKTEVLKLWMRVRQYFLNKIITEGEQRHLFLSDYSFRKILTKIGPSDDGIYIAENAEMFPFPCTTECDEVLFWISYCLSREDGITIQEVPHFVRSDIDWYKFSLESAVISGNVACFDYFNNFWKKKVWYDHFHMIERIFRLFRKDREQPCLIFNFMLLDSAEKADLFKKHPTYMLSHFLQWPLSQTFLENTEEIWNFIRDDLKSWVFLKLFAILFAENILLSPITDCGEFCGDYPGANTVIHSVEHLKSIWITLWKISPDCYKLRVLNEVILKSIQRSRRRRGFRANFKSLGLEKKLLDLFLSNGETVFELYEGVCMKKSLRSLVAKYMPEDFEDLNCRCISFLIASTSEYSMKMKRRMRLPLFLQRYRQSNRSSPVRRVFLDYIKRIISIDQNH